jgi:hypothetical protein
MQLLLQRQMSDTFYLLGVKSSAVYIPVEFTFRE